MTLPPANSEGYHYFTKAEFDCSFTGKNEIPDDFIHKLDRLRYSCGFPLVVTSGWRDVTHPAEATKKSPGEHNRAAADLAVSGAAQRMTLVKKALEMGFTGVGVADQFVHLDIRTETPVLWVY